MKGIKMTEDTQTAYIKKLNDDKKNIQEIGLHKCTTLSCTIDT